MKATCKDFIKFYNTANSYSIRWHTFYLYYLKIEAVSVSNELLLNMQRGIFQYYFIFTKKLS
jgi:predicted nucleic acid-binding OB-fold protein